MASRSGDRDRATFVCGCHPNPAGGVAEEFESAGGGGPLGGGGRSAELELVRGCVVDRVRSSALSLVHTAFRS